MGYAHRNGETEAPTVAGYYWVDHPDGTHVFFRGMAQMDEDGDQVSNNYDSDLAESRCRWWGPVIPPWEQDEYKDQPDIVTEGAKQHLQEREKEKELLAQHLAKHSR